MICVERDCYGLVFLGGGESTEHMHIILSVCVSEIEIELHKRVVGLAGCHRSAAHII